MKKNVLLVDDSLVDAMLTMRAMDDCEVDHRIETASDGEEAYRLTAENKFDLLLLDIKMPRVDGLELLKKLRDQSASRVPAIILSGSNVASDRERASALGAIEYAHKTMDYAEFKHELQAALNRHGFC